MTRIFPLRWIGYCAAVAMTMTGGQSFGADANNGERLARRWCSSCHIVGVNQRGPTSEAPPFATVARKPNFDAGKLAFFLLHPHPKMPDMGLSRTAATDLAAYIATLK
jgi:mono/diheme cytochrome c family protein